LRVIKSFLTTAIAAVSFCVPAFAGDYDVSPIGEKGAYIGCMATNAVAGVMFVAVQNNLSVMLSSKDFKVAKGDAVKGSWSVDGSKERALGAKADGDGTVSVDLEANKENIELFSNGNELSGTVGKDTMLFDLAGTKVALSDLGECMNGIAKK